MAEFVTNFRDSGDGCADVLLLPFQFTVVVLHHVCVFVGSRVRVVECYGSTTESDTLIVCLTRVLHSWGVGATAVPTDTKCCA